MSTLEGRSTVVLYGAYERALLASAIAGGLAKYVGLGDDELDAAEMAEWQYDTYYKHSHYKTSMLDASLR
jgi:hypothetical protein